MNGDRRGPWYLLTGVVLGLLIGLAIAWVVRPVEYVNTRPASLRADYKDSYRALIASAYLASGDLRRARARLELLQDEDMYRALAEQAQRTLAEGGTPQEARALGLLAIALGQPPPTVSPAAAVATASPSATVAAPSPAATATRPADSETRPAGSGTSPAGSGGTRLPATLAPTFTPLPSRTPTPTQGAPFILEQQELICDPKIQPPLIQVLALDAARQPVPGVEVAVTWEGGEERFFTGLKPELGLGYADFSLTPGVSYALRLADGGQPVSNLTAQECVAADGQRFYGSWRLVFVQP